MIKNNDLKRRIVELTYKHKLSHLSSCLNAVDVIKDIYDEKLPTDVFILSCGHAGLAQYVVLEKVLYDKTEGNKENRDLVAGIAEDILMEHGIHPTRVENLIDCSTGSLGQGLPIAIGMALADITRTVYCIISDGECAEGSIWESLALIDELNITNIRVYAILNGKSAYKDVDATKLSKRLRLFYPEIRLEYASLEGYPHLQDMGLLAHYRVLDETEYKDIMEYLK